MDATKIAAKLDGMVRAGVLPGLLPEDITKAAELLRKQDAELESLRAALATKQHIVNVTAERAHYSLKIRGEFVIRDPRIYFGEIAVDDRTMFGVPDQEWELHVARQLTHVATADWIRDLQEHAFIAVRAAIARAEGIAQPPTGDPSNG
jgi:hypothetical protein